MTTVINTPGGSNDGGMGVGLILGILVAVVVIGALIVYYGLPMIRQQPADQNTNIQVEIPYEIPTPEPTPAE